MAAKPWHWMGPTGLLTLVSCSGTVQKSKCTPQSPTTTPLWPERAWPPTVLQHGCVCFDNHVEIQQTHGLTSSTFGGVVAAVSTVLFSSTRLSLTAWALELLSCHRNTDCVSTLLRWDETFQFCWTSYVRRRLRRLCRRGGVTAPAPPERRVVFPTSQL